jgi:hypothetical protein
MTSLLSRLAQAKGPDRELDALAWQALTPKYARWKAKPDGWLQKGPFGACSPHLTTSLDAVLELLPEGWHLSNLRTPDPTTSRSNPSSLGFAQVCPNMSNDAGWAIGPQEGRAFNAPTSALIAILRARGIE